jgi:hypothetical protein
MLSASLLGKCLDNFRYKKTKVILLKWAEVYKVHRQLEYVFANPVGAINFNIIGAPGQHVVMLFVFGESDNATHSFLNPVVEVAYRRQHAVRDGQNQPVLAYSCRPDVVLLSSKLDDCFRYEMMHDGLRVVTTGQHATIRRQQKKLPAKERFVTHRAAAFFSESGAGTVHHT